MFSRKEVKAKGLASFKKYYWQSVVAALVLSACAYSSSSSSSRSASNSANSEGGLAEIFSNPAIIGIVVGAILVAVLFGAIVKIFVFNNLIVGCRKFFINIQHDDSKLGALVHTFKNGRYLNCAFTLFFVDLFTALWTLLFVIPGIVKSYEYRMIPYILADDPTIDRKEAFRMSKEMMMGNKMDAFVYDLSFFGWAILSVFTCGILAVFYVGPYKSSADAVLYETLKGKVTPEVVSSVEY